MAKFDLTKISNEELYAYLKKILSKWVKIYSDCHAKEDTPYGPYGKYAFREFDKDIGMVYDDFGFEVLSQGILQDYITYAFALFDIAMGENPELSKDEISRIMNAGLKYARTGDSSGFDSLDGLSDLAKSGLREHQANTKALFFTRKGAA